MFNAIIKNVDVEYGKNYKNGGSPTEVTGTAELQFHNGIIVKVFFNTIEEVNMIKDAYYAQKRINAVLAFIEKATPVMEEFTKELDQTYTSIPDYMAAYKASSYITKAVNAFLISNQYIDLVKLQYKLMKLTAFLDNWVRPNGERLVKYPEIQRSSKLTTLSEIIISKPYMTELNLGDDGEYPYIVWTDHSGQTMTTVFSNSNDLKEWYNR